MLSIISNREESSSALMQRAEKTLGRYSGKCWKGCTQGGLKKNEGNGDLNALWREDKCGRGEPYRDNQRLKRK